MMVLADVELRRVSALLGDNWPLGVDDLRPSAIRPRAVRVYGRRPAKRRRAGLILIQQASSS